ncbi:MAG TPA: aspartate carbamoyltransferase regulatory subunit [Candidatus Fournierella excrementavium]|uniref:aspartate carbamoyltransferase regulatory subunit n=1 Tax=Allofournierella TaxID=1940255 RepID=UPI0015AA5449|nr:aspartate carbamoyltransferase regulatory subunit [Fournierella sp.]MCI6960007.1 aspartate carbamoyltransferase regulatory subunit [Oscillospiraceae bacterium]MEE0755691.1 aspartate carbamoyltransferase regulatory subunit [Fournierella sp.]HJD17861.1 aspartate carbamoyltransferase regulatory subunit [Candidatus Fournierella excrementavium]
MLNIDSLEKGVVIDHIESGKSMEIYRVLELDKLDCSVAIIKNARSKKSGRKDIIKIEDRIDIDLDVLGFIDPNITVNIIDGGHIIEKKHLQLPERIVNVAKCKNPRCITSVEQELDHVFVLTDPEKGVYRCMYCEQEYKRG